MNEKISNEQLYELLKEYKADTIRQFADVNRQSSEIREDTNAFKADVNRQFGEVNKRLDRVDQRLDRLGDRLDRVENRMERSEHRLEGIEHKIDGVRVSWSSKLVGTIVTLSAAAGGVMGFIAGRLAVGGTKLVAQVQSIFHFS